ARTRRPRRRMHLARLHHATRLVRSRPPSRMGTRRRNRPRERGTHVPPPSPKVRPRRLGTPTRTRNALPHPARLARPPADAPPRRPLRTHRLTRARPPERVQPSASSRARSVLQHPKLREAPAPRTLRSHRDRRAQSREPTHNPTPASAVATTSCSRPFTSPAAQRRCCSIRTVSKLAVEKVVYPPRNPAPSAHCHSPPSAPAPTAPASTPSSSEPDRLITTVPHGSAAPNRRLAVAERIAESSAKRAAAPTPPASATARNSNGLMPPP